jgi:anti-sigma factor ChrR (cupin superfamily)
MQCREAEEKLAGYVEGVRDEQAAAIAAHLNTCDACRRSAHAQSVARDVLWCCARAPSTCRRSPLPDCGRG